MSICRQYVLKHYQELVKNPLPNVGVAPLEDDFTEWHVNFFFPEDHQYFPSLVLHLKMRFQDTYPSTSPLVTLCTEMKHSHVFFPTICFSLLPDFRGYFQQTATPGSAYWNPARTARSFLEDLYTFLLVDEDQHCRITPADGERAVKAGLEFTCSCGHTGRKPSPACPDLVEVAKERSLNDMAGAQTPNNQNGGSDTNSLPSQVMEDLRCSITGRSFLDEGEVIGFGVNVEELPGGKIRIDTDLSPICWRAFSEDKIRTTSDGNAITHFIPYVINDKHFTSNAKRILEVTVDTITSKRNMNKTNGLLFVLGEIWKSKAVLLMSGREHASEKALKGFCAIHHLLLSCSKYLPLVETTTKNVKDFIESPDNCTKTKVPDLGQFLTFFLLSNVTWNGKEKAGTAVVREQFVRNALWITKQLPDMANTQQHLTDRVDLSWGPSATGLKLVALQIRFLLALPGWATSFQLGAEAGLLEGQLAGPAAKVDAGWEVWGMYNALGGRPTEDMLVAFQMECKRVQAMASYQHYFAALGLGMPTKQQCHDMLVAAMQRSAALGYHGRDGSRGGGREGVGHGGRGRGGGRGRW